MNRTSNTALGLSPAPTRAFRAAEWKFITARHASCRPKSDQNLRQIRTRHTRPGNLIGRSESANWDTVPMSFSLSSPTEGVRHPPPTANHALMAGERTLKCSRSTHPDLEPAYQGSGADCPHSPCLHRRRQFTFVVTGGQGDSRIALEVFPSGGETRGSSLEPAAPQGPSLSQGCVGALRPKPLPSFRVKKTLPSALTPSYDAAGESLAL